MMHRLPYSLALLLANLNAFALAQAAPSVVTVTVSTCYSGSTIPSSLAANSTALDSSASTLSQSATALPTHLSLSSSQSTNTIAPVSASSASSTPLGYPSDTSAPAATSTGSTSGSTSATSTAPATDSSAASSSLTSTATSSEAPTDVPTPVYSTPSSTDTSAPSATNAPVSFAIQASGGPNDGQWAYIDQSAFEIVFTADQTQAAEFALYSNGTLITPVDGKVANQDNGANFEPFYFSTWDDVAAQDYQLFSCSLGPAVTDTTSALSCVANGINNIVQSEPTDPDVAYIGSDLQQGEQFNLVAVSGLTFAQS